MPNVMIRLVRQQIVQNSLWCRQMIAQEWWTSLKAAKFASFATGSDHGRNTVAAC